MILGKSLTLKNVSIGTLIKGGIQERNAFMGSVMLNCSGRICAEASIKSPTPYLALNIVLESAMLIILPTMPYSWTLILIRVFPSRLGSQIYFTNSAG